MVPHVIPSTTHSHVCVQMDILEQTVSIQVFNMYCLRGVLNALIFFTVLNCIKYSTVDKRLTITYLLLYPPCDIRYIPEHSSLFLEQVTGHVEWMSDFSQSPS